MEPSYLVDPVTVSPRESTSPAANIKDSKSEMDAGAKGESHLSSTAEEQQNQPSLQDALVMSENNKVDKIELPEVDQEHLEKEVQRANEQRKDEDGELVVFEGPDGELKVICDAPAGTYLHAVANPPKHRHKRLVRPDGKVELTENLAPEVLGFAYPRWKKWLILCVVFVVQVSMNYNTSVYPNAVEGITKDKDRYPGVTSQGARVGQMIFLVAYSFASELWAPWSEEFGRWPVLQLSLFLVNLTQIWAAFAPNFSNLIAARFFGGLFTAGGGVTLSVVADLYHPDWHQFAIAFIVLSSTIGTSIGPFIGGFIVGGIHHEPPSNRNSSLYWIFWSQLVFGFFTQILHFFLVSETRSTVLLTREAKRLRKMGKTYVYSSTELKENRFSVKEMVETWMRPFHMFVFEPIVLSLSLLSGFSDMLIFIFMESFQLVYTERYNFGKVQNGLAFLPVLIGYVIAYFSFMPTIIWQRKVRREKPGLLLPEVRLWWLLFLAPLEPLGLFGFSWTTMGSPQSHWIAPMVFTLLISIANYAIYMATIDYMVEAYGEYSASATGGNALARDFLAGISAMFASPMFEKFDPKHKQGWLSMAWATMFLGFVAIIVIIPAYIFYWKGEWVRKNSKFAQELMKEHEDMLDEDPNVPEDFYHRDDKSAA